MRRHLFLVTFVLFVSHAHHASTTPGSVELDLYNFDKVTKKFEASLIKFDILFPFGDKHEAFMSFANESIDEKDLLIAQVLVKNYADKTNEAFARRYGVTKNNFPVILLFVKGKSEPIPLDKAKGFTSDDLRSFVQEKSGLYLSLPGCIKEFDKLAIQFMKSKKNERKKVMKKAEVLLKATDKLFSRKIYITIMEKVLEKGDDFVLSELDRVKKILSGKVSDEKKKQLETRINILLTFQLFDKQKIAKEDL